MSKPLIAIVNSSSFGVSFPEHLRTLEAFADLIRIDIPNNAPASVFHEKLGKADGIIASVTPIYTREVLLPGCRFLPATASAATTWTLRPAPSLASRFRASARKSSANRSRKWRSE